MPLSPLIRPLSPLQTQSAPALPDPYSLADARVEAGLMIERETAHALHSTPPVAKRYSHSGSSSSNSGGQQPTSVSPSASPAPSRAAAPTFHTFITHDSAVAANTEQQHVRSAQTLDVPNRQPIHSSTPTSELGRRMQISSEAAHTRRGGTSPSPKPLLPSALFPQHASPATTATVQDAAVATSSAATPAWTHPYAKASAMAPSSMKDHNGSGSKRGVDLGAPACRRSPASFLSPTKVTTSTALLHASTAPVAVAASTPSYGASLLRRASPVLGCRSFQRRCNSPPPSTSTLRFKGAAPLSEFHDPSHHAQDSVAWPFALTDVDWKEVHGDAGGCDRATNAAASKANCYRGTAVSSRTGRLYNIAIEASLLDADSAVHPPDALHPCAKQSDNLAGRKWRRIASVLSDKHPKQRWISTSDDETSDGDAGSSTAAENACATEVERDRKTKSLAARTASPTSPCSSPQPGHKDMTTSPQRSSPRASPPPPPSYPRYVYPALDDCQRLLQEIQSHSPLMRRCLTPPRPLLAATRDMAVAAAGTAAATTTVLDQPLFNAETGETTTHTKTVTQKTEGVGCLGPGPDARRLYDWDAATAAADLSFTCGPFQQSAEHFATATTRQLRRLRGTAARFYATESDGGDTTTARSSARLLSAGAPHCSVDSVAYPRAALAHLWQPPPRTASADVVELEVDSPSWRLRRLLRETEAAFPVLWRTTHVHATTAASSAASAYMDEHERSSGQEDSAAGVFITPSPSTIQPLQGERDVTYREDDEAASVKGGKSDFTLSRLNGTFSLSSEEHGARIDVSSLTPARPPPPPLNFAGAPLAAP